MTRRRLATALTAATLLLGTAAAPSDAAKAPRVGETSALTYTRVIRLDSFPDPDRGPVYGQVVYTRTANRMIKIRSVRVWTPIPRSRVRKFKDVRLKLNNRTYRLGTFRRGQVKAVDGGWCRLTCVVELDALVDVIGDRDRDWVPRWQEVRR